jgi:RHS repeat-associated protein
MAYNAHHKTTEIVSDPMPSQGNDTGTVDFMYGADESRVVQVLASAGTISRTVYVGLGGTGKSMYERTTKEDSGNHVLSVQHVNFIYAGSAHGGNPFAVRTMDANGSPTGDRYFSFDHLGSTTAVSDEKGHIATTTGSDAGVLGYDPWGARRNPDGTAANWASFTPQVGHREFTGQETIPDVGLVNMNGRVYDPVLARFLSPDPNIQDSTDPQNYNRYSYVVNNPLRYTDPTGYSFFGDLANFFENPANDFFLLGSIVTCASTAVGCLAFGVLQTVVNVASAADAGASFSQTAISIGVGVGFSFLTMGTVSAFGGGGLATIIGGSVSAAAATALTDVVTGHTPGWDVAVSAFVSATSGAITYGLQQAAAVSRASAGQNEGGIDYREVEKKITELTDGKNAPQFQVLESTRGRFWTWLLGPEYRLTGDAVNFLQPKLDEVMAGTGYHLDVSQVRFTLDENLGAPGRWTGGMDVKLQSASSSFNLTWKFTTHEIFHIAQGLVAGGGDLSLGWRIVQANYLHTDLFSRPLDTVSWNKTSVIDAPFEFGAQNFTDKLFDAYWGHQQ